MSSNPCMLKKEKTNSARLPDTRSIYKNHSYFVFIHLMIQRLTNRTILFIIALTESHIYNKKFLYIVNKTLLREINGERQQAHWLEDSIFINMLIFLK
jgi:hypothetical protein